jgi:CheY-like chemotaxis protein
MPACPNEAFGHDFGGARILVIDDEESVRRIVGRMLCSCNCRVIEAGDGFEALLLLEREPGVDLVLTDLAMPRLGGLAVAESVALRHPGIPVVVMSGNGAAMAAAPHVPVVWKPFTTMELLGVVEQHLARPARAPARGERPLDSPVQLAPRTRYRSPPR